MTTEDPMKRIRRESDTEKWVRSRDTSEIVDALIQLEDEVEKLQGHTKVCKETLGEIIRVRAGLGGERSAEDRMNRICDLAGHALVDMEG